MSREAAWAPLAVVLLHALLSRTGLRASLDWLLHFLGGLAMAFFLYSASRLAFGLRGGLPRVALHLLTFSLTCTVALFWEFGEFLSDRCLGTHVQQGLSETMQDLLFGALGAAAYSGLALLVSVGRSNTDGG